MFFPIQEQNIIISLHIVKGVLPKPTSFAKVATYSGSAVHFSQNLASRLLLYFIFLCHPNFYAWLKKSKMNKMLSSANVGKVFRYTQELGMDEALLNFFSLKSHLYIFFQTLCLFVWLFSEDFFSAVLKQLPLHSKREVVFKNLLLLWPQKFKAGSP